MLLGEITMTMELVALIYFIINLLSLYTPKDNFLTFINKPETIIQNGTIYKRSYNTPTTERIFIHLKNGTDKNQTLYIKTTKPLIYNKAINTHPLPPIAGNNTTKNFLKNITQNKTINIETIIPPFQTISGIIDLQTKDNKINIYINNNNKIISTNYTQTNYNINKNYTIEQNEIKSFKLGNLTDTLKGQYGNTITYNFKTINKGKIKLICSPRADNTILTYKHNQKIYTTKLMKTKSYNTILITQTKENQTHSFTFINTGGNSYPINLYLKYI